MNVLIYLNPDWKEEYGGAFEVWTNGMTQQERRTSQSTVFKRRPATGGARSNEAVLRVVRDLVPPLVYRKTHNVIDRIRRKL